MGSRVESSLLWDIFELGGLSMSSLEDGTQLIILNILGIKTFCMRRKFTLKHLHYNEIPNIINFVVLNVRI